MIRIRVALVLGFVLASNGFAAASKTAAAPQAAPPFGEQTTVHGKVPVDLGGTWFVVPHIHMAKDPTIQKFRTMPEIIQITYAKDGTPSFHLLDAKLPPPMAATIKAHNDKLEAWTPTDEDLKLLAKELPRMKPTADKDKDVVAGDVAYGQIVYAVVSPDKYDEVFTRKDATMEDVLSGTSFVIQVSEAYRALPIPPGSNVAPLMERNAIYGVSSADGRIIEGKQAVAFIAAGIGQPIPLGMGGAFRMYRIAGAPRGKGAPKAATAPAKPAPAAKPKSKS